MTLDSIIDEIVADLPWADHIRLVAGPLCGRESVKDRILERVDVVPGAAAGTLSEVARDILNKSKVSVDKPLTAASQCDALERIAGQEFLKKALPELCTHLKARPVAMKIARFLTELERYYVHDDELEAVIEYFKTRDERLGVFIELVTALWRQGELVPWGEGQCLRQALTVLESPGTGEGLPKKLWLWGVYDLSPLEERFLEALVRRGVEVRLTVPQAAAELFAARAGHVGLKLDVLEEPARALRVWEPHSTWDEVEFLRDELERLQAAGVRLRDIAIFVPNDDLYKRFVRQKLFRWNVPLHDPQLSGAWKDNAAALWWRDLLRLLASGLKLEDVRAWLGPGPGRKELFETAFKFAVHGGAGQWAKLAEKHGFPELKLLVEGTRLFARSMTVEQFARALDKLASLTTELLGSQPGAELLSEFGRHLREERPYLATFRGRLPRFVPLFEEFLGIQARAASLRADDGVRFVAHGVWLPQTARHAFVLGAGHLSRARPSADLWDWQAVEVRRIWDRLHFGLSFEERVRRDEAFTLYGLLAHEDVVLSAAAYDINGAMMPTAAIFERLKKDAAPVERAGGHLAVGWSRPPQAAREVDVVLRPDLAPNPVAEQKPLRVSSFEDYLKCPFVYFARHVLVLESENELGLDPDGRARGNILHKALERFLAEEIAGIRHLNAETARKRLHQLIDEEVGRGGALTGMYRHAPLVEKARGLLKAQATRWLEWEFNNRVEHPELKPFAVELPIEFALSERFTFKGKADRVDSDGRHSVVIDYKSGGAPIGGKELLAGVGAQLLMYAKGVERKEKLEPGGAFYLELGRQVKNQSGVFLKKHKGVLHSKNGRSGGFYDGEFETLFERVTESWRAAADRLAAGDFAPKPALPKKCVSCQYQSICGYQAPEVDE